MAPVSRNRDKKSRKLRIGPSFFVVIVGLQLVVVWHYFMKALPPSDTQSIVPPVDQKIEHGDHRDRVVQEQEGVQNVLPAAEPQQHGEPPKDMSVSSSTKLWHRSYTLPLWIQEYFDWADEQQRNLNEENWRSHRYLVMQCLKTDAHCGGTSDRLKPIPLLVLLAMRSKRLLYIRWTRPCPLEEFIVPPENGYNWTMPQWLVPYMDSKEATKTPIRVNNKNVINDAEKNITVLRARLQTFDGGSIYFNEQFNSTGVSYESIYHDLFRILFQPAAPVQKIIDDELKSVGLTPGEYATAHYRAFYGKRLPDDEKIRSTAVNAVECASELRPGGPVYFASDSSHAIQSIKNYAQEHSRPVVIIQNDEPLHLDKANSTNAADYYNVFVDLFLLGMGRCGSVGMGGFGRYGLLLSYNASCWNRHSYNRQRMDCHWKDAPNAVQ